jgi:hypothetical protein
MRRPIAAASVALFAIALSSAAQDPGAAARTSRLNSTLAYVAPSFLFSRLENGSLDEPLGLDGDQVRYIKRVDSLTRRCLIRASAGHDLAVEDSARNFSSRRAAIVEAAESLVLHGLFRPDQARGYARMTWAQRGVEALLEVEVADRIGLSRRQRQEVAQRVADRRMGDEAVHAEVGGSLKSMVPGEGDQVMGIMKATADELERRIWAVLSPAQLKKWEEMTGSRPAVLKAARN